ncbi:MAG: GYF domain-containing protein [Prevotella sp.]|jgi:hypothetical protein
MKYFIIVNDSQMGPFSIEELAQQGLRSDTLVWREGMADWQPAWKIEELRPLLRSINTGTPPPPPENGQKEGETTGTQDTVRTESNSQGNQYGQTGQTSQDNLHGQTYPSEQVENQSEGQETRSDSNIQPRKKSSTPIVVAILVGVLLIILAITNPTAQAHRDTVREHVASAIEQSINTSSDGGFFSQIMGNVGRMVALSVLDEGLDSMLEYHNYVICSKTTFTFNGKTSMASFGILGHIFTADEEELSKKIGDKMTITKEQRIYDSTDDTAPDASQSEVEVTIEDSLQDLPSRIGKRISSDIAEEVSKEVKRQIDENTDSTTRTTIGELIDEVKKWFN